MPPRFAFNRAKDAQRDAALKMASTQRTIPTATAVPWDPEITSTGTPPVISLGSGIYVRSNHLIVAWAKLLLGVSSVGTGAYRISLPAALAAAAVTDGATVGGTWEYQSALSPFPEAHGHIFVDPASSDSVRFGYWSAYPTGNRLYVGAAQPWVPSSGDVLHFTVIAKVATGA